MWRLTGNLPNYIRAQRERKSYMTVVVVVDTHLHPERC